MSCTTGASRHRLLNYETTYIKNERWGYRFEANRSAKLFAARPGVLNAGGSRLWDLSNRCIYSTDLHDPRDRRSKINMII
jgi:hypothetical protein